MIGKEWNNLPQEQRKPYLLKATNERKRYERETEEYRAKLTQNRKEQERQRKSDLQQEREGIRSIGQIDKDCKASELS